MPSCIDVASRASPLARAQVEEVLAEGRLFYPDLSFCPLWVETRGDRDLVTSLRTLGKSNFFTQEIDDLLLSGACRLAIHSAKDLPDPLPKGLRVVALTEGADPADVLVFRDGGDLSAIPLGGRVGVSCERRERVVRSLRPDVRCVDIRGAIGERLHQLDTGVVDAVVVAEAALIRLQLTHRSRMRLNGPVAPAQGQLALVAREEDSGMWEQFRPLDVRRRSVLYLGIDPARWRGRGRVTHYPVIRIHPRPPAPEVREALPAVTHILFTSRSAVSVFFSAYEYKGAALRLAIGPGTAEQLAAQGLPAHLIAEEETQEGMIALLSRLHLQESYVLLPHAARARPLLAQHLQAAGVRHLAHPLYDTLPQRPEPVPLLSGVDVIVFTSPSTVEAFLEIYGAVPERKRCVSIGPITARALRTIAPGTDPHLPSACRATTPLFPTPADRAQDGA